MKDSENKILKKKLDELWDKYEEEKELVASVTRNEVDNKYK